jgi:hypothetical protein
MTLPVGLSQVLETVALARVGRHVYHRDLFARGEQALQHLLPKGRLADQRDLHWTLLSGSILREQF